MIRPRSMLSVCVVASFAACGGEGTAPNGVREIVANPSFATHVNEIFQRNGCGSGDCHGPGGSGTEAGLTLTASAAANYGVLVNAEAGQNPSLLRVNPGDAATSYLVIKLSPNPPTGARMPRNAAPLDNIDMTNIRNWINNGAPNN